MSWFESRGFGLSKPGGMEDAAEPKGVVPAKFVLAVFMVRNAARTTGCSIPERVSRFDPGSERVRTTFVLTFDPCPRMLEGLHWFNSRAYGAFALIGATPEWWGTV